MVTKAVILAGGKGTRFLPYTKAYPKEMLAVVDKPALQLIVEEIVNAGITDIFVVLSPDKQAVVKHFEKDATLEQLLRSQGKDAEADSVKALSEMAHFTYGWQQSVTGTGMAVMLAEQWADGQPFVVLNGDDVIYNEGETVTHQIVRQFDKVGKSVVGVQKVGRDVINKYASCKVVEGSDRLFLIDDIIEKPTSQDQIYSLLAPLGRYVVTNDIFDYIRNSPSRNGEVCLTDALRLQAQQHGIYAYDFMGKRYDFGDKLGYVMGVTEYALRDEHLGDKYRQYLKKLAESL